jgi:hypothetical protein
MIIRRNKCLLCGLFLVNVIGQTFQKHPKSATCEVLFTDEWGIALDEAPIAHSEVDDDGIINISSYPRVARALLREHDRGLEVSRLPARDALPRDGDEG